MCIRDSRHSEDIALLGEMGIKLFRMSIAWSRIFPTGVELSLIHI